MRHTFGGIFEGICGKNQLTHPECGQCYPMGWGPGLNKKGKGEIQLSALIPFPVLTGVTSHFHRYRATLGTWNIHSMMRKPWWSPLRATLPYQMLQGPMKLH